MNIDAINSWSDTEAREVFLRCCGSRRWAEQMVLRRPFSNDAELFATADQVWHGLTREDWLEAFSAHPKIGGVDSLRKKFAATATWSANEQSDVAGASEDVLQGLAEGNLRYETKFGYIFIICATGKTAAEMLAQLQARLNHDPEDEINLAAAEQAKITRLRLQKL